MASFFYSSDGKFADHSVDTTSGAAPTSIYGKGAHSVLEGHPTAVYVQIVNPTTPTVNSSVGATLTLNLEASAYVGEYVVNIPALDHNIVQSTTITVQDGSVSKSIVLTVLPQEDIALSLGEASLTVNENADGRYVDVFSLNSYKEEISVSGGLIREYLRPSGVYGIVSSPSDINLPVFSEDVVSGAVLTVPWSMLEPTEGNYNFSVISQAISNLGSKKLSLKISPEEGSIPSHIVNNTAIGAWYNNETDNTNPNPWSPTLWDKYNSLLEALANSAHLDDTTGQQVALKDHKNFEIFQTMFPGFPGNSLRTFGSIEVKNLPSFNRSVFTSALNNNLLSVKEHLPNQISMAGLWEITDNLNEVELWRYASQIIESHDMTIYQDDFSYGASDPTTPRVLHPQTSDDGVVLNEAGRVALRALDSWSNHSPVNAGKLAVGTLGDGIQRAMAQYNCYCFEVALDDLAVEPNLTDIATNFKSVSKHYRWFLPTYDYEQVQSTTLDVELTSSANQTSESLDVTVANILEQLVTPPQPIEVLIKSGSTLETDSTVLQSWVLTGDSDANNLDTLTLTTGNNIVEFYRNDAITQQSLITVIEKPIPNIQVPSLLSVFEKNDIVVDFEVSDLDGALPLTSLGYVVDLGGDNYRLRYPDGFAYDSVQAVIITLTADDGLNDPVDKVIRIDILQSDFDGGDSEVTGNLIYVPLVDTNVVVIRSDLYQEL